MYMFAIFLHVDNKEFLLYFTL